MRYMAAEAAITMHAAPIPAVARYGFEAKRRLELPCCTTAGRLALARLTDSVSRFGTGCWGLIARPISPADMPGLWAGMGGGICAEGSLPAAAEPPMAGAGAFDRNATGFMSESGIRASTSRRLKPCASGFSPGRLLASDIFPRCDCTQTITIDFSRLVRAS